MQMATPQTAMDLIEQLRQASYNTAAKELEDVRLFAASQVRNLSQVTRSCVKCNGCRN